MKTIEGTETDAVLITGISSGIGHGLARAYLDRGYIVYGTSRRAPNDLLAHSALHYVAMDLAQHASVPRGLEQLLPSVGRLPLVVLNAGIYGVFGDLVTTPLADVTKVMDVNVWANKLILDWLFTRPIAVGQVVAISSGASINGNRGWNAYALSKAALNMLVKLYAREQPDTHFCALSPGLVETAMLDDLLALPEDARYPSLDVLRAKKNTADMPDPDEAAQRLLGVFPRLPDLVESGAYADIRRLPPGAPST